MKKIIIACDSYKGCLSSREVNEAIASGIKVWNTDAASSEMKNLYSDDAAPEIKKLSPDEVSPEIITLEMSDGGEGMLDAFLSAMKGERDEGLIQSKTDGLGTSLIRFHFQFSCTHRILQGLHDETLRIADGSIKIKNYILHYFLVLISHASSTRPEPTVTGRRER